MPIIPAVLEAATMCPRPLQVNRCPFDLESCVRATCDVGYLCSRVRPYVRDRQTDRRQTKASLNASALWGRRHNNAAYTLLFY